MLMAGLPLKCKTYTLRDLLLDGEHDPIDPTPVILVLSSTTDDAETFEDVNDIVDAASFHAELLSALVEV